MYLIMKNILVIFLFNYTEFVRLKREIRYQVQESIKEIFT
jgi:hypothetical protein